MLNKLTLLLRYHWHIGGVRYGSRLSYNYIHGEQGTSAQKKENKFPGCQIVINYFLVVLNV